MRVYSYNTFAVLYDEVINDMINEIKSNEKEQAIDTRDGSVIIAWHNVCLEFNAMYNIPNDTYKKFNLNYALAEHEWYAAATNKLKPMQQFTSGWNRMSDDGIHINSNYGYCIKHKYGFDQYKYVVELIKKDKNTRQAIIHIKEPSNKITKDTNCTCYLAFSVVNNTLNLAVHMRSNDVFLGTPYDVFQFTLLQWQMAMELNLSVGKYVHIVDNMHMYYRDYLKYIKDRRK